MTDNTSLKHSSVHHFTAFSLVFVLCFKLLVCGVLASMFGAKIAYLNGNSCATKPSLTLPQSLRKMHLLIVRKTLLMSG